MDEIDIMLDTETLDTENSAAIVQLSAVAFEPKSGGRIYNDKIFNTYINLDSSLAYGRTVDADTVNFWLTQPDKARLKIAAGVICDTTLTTALVGLMMWPNDVLFAKHTLRPSSPKTPVSNGWAKIRKVWAHGTVFDIAKLNESFKAAGLKVPWHRNSVMDTKTFYSLIGGAPEVESYGDAHDAADDCVYQCTQLQVAMSSLGQ